MYTTRQIENDSQCQNFRGSTTILLEWSAKTPSELNNLEQEDVAANQKSAPHGKNFGLLFGIRSHSPTLRLSQSVAYRLTKIICRGGRMFPVSAAKSNMCVAGWSASECDNKWPESPLKTTLQRGNGQALKVTELSNIATETTFATPGGVAPRTLKSRTSLSLHRYSNHML